MSNHNRLSGRTFASNKNNRPMRLLTNATAVLAFLLFSACTSSAVTSQVSNNEMNDPAVTAVVEQFADAEDFDGFVFEGQEDASDHASAAQPPSGKVTGVVEWHVNTDESGLMS